MSPSVVIHRAQNIESALVLVNFLQFHGLDAQLDNGAHASIDWGIVPALGGIAVRLPDAQVKDAKVLLKTALVEARDSPDFGEPVQLRPIWHKRLLAWSMLGLYTGALQALLALLLVPAISMIPPGIVDYLPSSSPRAYIGYAELGYLNAPTIAGDLKKGLWVVLGFVAFLIALERVTRPQPQENMGEHE